MKSTGSDKPPQHLFAWRNAIRCDRTITAEDYHVALEYSMYADMDGTNCWPGEARVAGALRRTERSVRRRVAKLVKRGWMTLEHRGHGGAPGKSKPSVYRLTIPRDIGHTCPVCPTVKGHWCPRHRTWVAETPDTGDQDIGHSYVHLPPSTSPDISLENEIQIQEQNPERDEIESAFTSERDTQPRSERERGSDEFDGPFGPEHEDRGHTDPVIRRAIKVFVDRKDARATRQQMIETVDACRFDLNIDDRVIEEALGKVEKELDKDPNKVLWPRYLTKTVAQQYSYNSGRGA